MRYILFLLLLLQLNLTAQSQDEEFRRNALEVHHSILTLDSHTDTPLWMSRHIADLTVDQQDFEQKSRVDYNRMRQGGLSAVVFAVWTFQDDIAEPQYEKVQERAKLLIDSVYRSLEYAEGEVNLCLTADDVRNAYRNGKTAVLIGLENGYPIAKDITRVKHYYERGIRYITLCHIKNNDICDSSNDEKPLHNGVSDFGKNVIKEMNRLGMLIDVSHISDKAFYDVMELSDAPVVASHSCVKAICDNPRNMTDDMIKTLAEKGGVIQIALFSDYLRDPPENKEREKVFDELHKRFAEYNSITEAEQEKLRKDWDVANEKYPVAPATIRDLADHIDYVVNLVGVDHVGIGSDFDGGGRLPDCSDVSEVGNITVELMKRGYTREDLEKIWGGNFLRVLKQVEESAGK